MKAFALPEWVQPHLIDLKPYSSARDEYTGAEGTFLDANENPFGSAIAEGQYHRYPDPYQRELKALIAADKGVQSDQVFLGNGSDEAIDLLYRLSCTPGKHNVITLPPTYGMYSVSAGIQQVAVKSVPLTEDFQLRTSAILASIDQATKMIFVCSPNNPSGNLMDATGIESLLTSFSGVVVVDEAYIDFAHTQGALPLLNQYPNLVVLQTFSKAWGMAALRLGMAFAHPELIAFLNKIKPPYNVNQVTQSLGITAMKQKAKKEEYVHLLLKERERLAERLEANPLVEKVYPSEANFLLVRVQDTLATFGALTAQKVIVRDRSRVTHCAGCLRITVGTPEENDALIAALNQISKN